MNSRKQILRYESGCGSTRIKQGFIRQWLSSASDSSSDSNFDKMKPKRKNAVDRLPP